jgi:hypothetical protein
LSRLITEINDDSWPFWSESANEAGEHPQHNKTDPEAIGRRQKGYISSSVIRVGISPDDPEQCILNSGQVISHRGPKR